MKTINLSFNQSEVGEVQLKVMVAGQRGVLDDVCYKFTDKKNGRMFVPVMISLSTMFFYQHPVCSRQLAVGSWQPGKSFPSTANCRLPTAGYFSCSYFDAHSALSASSPFCPSSFIRNVLAGKYGFRCISR